MTSRAPAGAPSRPGVDAAPLVSVVLSFRNEEQVLPELIARLTVALAATTVRYELIFVNDDSSDRSRELLEEERRRDARIKLINMSRRFGVAECVVAGMRYSRGDAVVMMDTDLQDPPELLPELVRKWREGADVVYTVRSARAGEPRYKVMLTRWAYRVIGAIANLNLPVEAGDFKLLSRRVADELMKLEEKDPYLRGLVTWIGFKQVPVYYERQPRHAGETHFPLFRSKGPFVTLVTGLTSFSMIPLTGFLAVGSAVCMLAVVGGMWAVGRALLLGEAAGLMTVGSVLLFVSGVQLVGLGIIGIYLGRVFNDVRNRPRYIVESAVGFDGDQEAAS
jgi:dolichol-phosphate mannosyltransferase